MARAALLLALVLWLSPLPGRAGEGVVEINHPRILEGGIVAADAPGYPATLNATGAYVLAGNLSIPDENTHGIEVLAANVSIDLNGFSILAKTGCTGTPVTSCAPLGSGHGIVSSAPRTVVRNGAVGNTGDDCIAGSEMILLDLQPSECGVTGAHLGDASSVIRVTASRNGNRGVSAGSGMVVLDSVARGNGATGLEVVSGVIGRSAAYVNGNAGMAGGVGTTLHDDSARGNLGNGMTGSDGSTLRGNTSSNNKGSGSG